MEKLQKLIKIEKKLQKIYLTFYNLLIAQGLWQTHYQILSTNEICDCFHEYTNLKDDL